MLGSIPNTANKNPEDTHLVSNICRFNYLCKNKHPSQWMFLILSLISDKIILEEISETYLTY